MLIRGDGKMLEQRQNLIQHQKLMLSHNMLSAITVMQMSSLNLRELLENEAQINPALEISEKDVFTPLHIIANKTGKNNSDIHSGKHFIQDPIDEGQTLEEDLLFQLKIATPPEGVYKIASYIIDNLDESGYLRMPVSGIAADLSENSQNILDSITLVQSFDPPGIAARSLEECIEIQLRRSGDFSEEDSILLSHLQNFERSNIRSISAVTGISEEKIRRFLKKVRTLNPKPGSFYSRENIKYVYPTIILKEEDNKINITLNNQIEPKIHINKLYLDILKSTGKHTAQYKFVRQNIDSALWLMHCVNQRKLITIKVAETIFDWQDEFLLKGIICPMTLSDIAEEIGKSVSTVSRIVNGKYIQTPRGIFELKYFFKCRSGVSFHKTFSERKDLQLVKDIIQNEDSSKPLSDMEIMSRLNELGCSISRRTVTKYRHMLGYGTSLCRKA
jgi:RNA polymerase sigma-54 factor